IHGKKAPRLDGMKFSVLGLGDSSYQYFCNIGREFDERFEALGGQRVVDRRDLDVDYEDDASQWLDKALEAFVKELDDGEQAHPTVTHLPGAAAPAQAAQQTDPWSRKNPFEAELLDNVVLNA